MNLADAIRKAALAAGHQDPCSPASLSAEPTHGEKTFPNPHTPSYQEYQGVDSVTPEEIESEGEVEVMSVRNGEIVSPNDMPQVPLGPTTAVRLELFLAPEQVSSLMRCIVATQHSVMTLREAAHFLRIPGANLEQLATDRVVPAFQVDGKWRFSRTALDEWLSDQGRQREAS
jgi:excisionase family DNA binding protein